MAQLSEAYLRSLANQRVRNDSRFNNYNGDSLQKSILSESFTNFSATKVYDIFLSHSYLDKELILGLDIELQNMGYSVYVDWIDDSQLDRSHVTVSNVITIKERMKASKCLLLATSSNSSDSKWIPWELGYMDGFRNRVAISPISGSSQSRYNGTEYLGIYPYLEKAKPQGGDTEILWITDQGENKMYSKFDDWIRTGVLTKHS